MKKKMIRSFDQKSHVRTRHVRVKPLIEAIRACFKSLPLGLSQCQDCQTIVSHRNVVPSVPRTMTSAAVCAAVVLVASDQEALASSGNFVPAIPNRFSEQIVSHNEVIFLDTRVPDYERLAKGIKPGREVILLDPDGDGIAQITAVLARHTDLNAVHIVSHGQPGQLQLGNTWLSMENLEEYALPLKSWFPERKKSVNRRPDVVIYACSVAEGSHGRAFVERVGELTGADITASSDRTGAARLGGDWVLELDTGNIDTGLAFTPQALINYPFALDALTVTNLNDSGPGSLRQAIMEANTNPSADEIVFEGSGASGTIDLASDLPDVTDDLNINGPGAEALTIKGGDLNFVFDFSFDDIYDSRGTVTDVTIMGGSVGAVNAEIAINNSTLTGSKGPALRGPNEASFTLENTIISGSCSDSEPEPGPFGCAAVQMSEYTNILGALSMKDSVVTGSGGNGIFASATTRLANSTISENAGFGIVPGEREVCGLVVENSAISGNKQDGIYDDGICDEFLRIKVLNSTISGNGGNGILGSRHFYFPGLGIEIESSTIAGNDGNGILINSDEQVLLRNTIVANNALQDCDNRVESLGNNLIGDPQGCDVVLQTSDLTGDPGLGDFVDPGTPGGGHMPLLATSRAIDSGNDEACPETDQLGVARPQGTACDIGAIEFEKSVSPEDPDLVLDKFSYPDPVTIGNPLSYYLTVRNAGMETARRVRILDTLPSSVKLISFPEVCKARRNRVSCALGDLDSGVEYSLEIVVRPNKKGKLVNRARVSFRGEDTNPYDNRVRQVTTVTRR